MLALILILALGGIYIFFLKWGKSSGRYESQATRLHHTIDALDSLLPQTQCGKCHYPGCRPYAEAIAKGEADIYQCPPGGEPTVHAIAQVMGIQTPELSRVVDDEGQRVALIDEDICIGCVKCIQACPVDAIMGTHKKMHTVIKKYCTGCELCVPACPVDCISMVPTRVKTREWVWSKPDPDKRLST